MPKGCLDLSAIVLKTASYKISLIISTVVGITAAACIIFFLPELKWLVIPVFILQAVFAILLSPSEVKGIKEEGVSQENKAEEKQKQDDRQEFVKPEKAEIETTENLIRQLQEYSAQQTEENKMLKESREKFRHAAFHDPLTDLPNQSLFVETLKFSLEKHKQVSGFNFAVFYIDVNRFKTFNNSLGHKIGDEIIKHIAQVLKSTVRKGDLVARFGGDRFGVILGQIDNIELAKDFASLIVKKLSNPYPLNGNDLFFNFSIGIAIGNKKYNQAEDVLHDAHLAMKLAKEREQPIEVFTHEMHLQSLKRQKIETDLRNAIERNELRAFFQPIVDLNTLKLEGFEALIRWEHPTDGMISPGDFIPVSEETNLIVPITLWMLNFSCYQLVKWQKESPEFKDLFLSVNISGKHFAQPGLVNQVKKIISDTGISPDCLKLELTESAVMENPENVIAMLKELKRLNIRLSIDDFGTGYSSLSYLHRFPIDTLKVDRSFVSTMEEKSENGEIVRTIMSLAKTLGMNVIAEGIESIHQLHQLRVLNCEYGQGYLFSKPVPVKEAEILLKDTLRWQNMLPAAVETTPLQIQTTQ